MDGWIGLDGKKEIGGFCQWWLVEFSSFFLPIEYKGVEQTCIVSIRYLTTQERVRYPEFQC